MQLYNVKLLYTPITLVPFIVFLCVNPLLYIYLLQSLKGISTTIRAVVRKKL